MIPVKNLAFQYVPSKLQCPEWFLVDLVKESSFAAWAWRRTLGTGKHGHPRRTLPEKTLSLTQLSPASQQSLCHSLPGGATSWIKSLSGGEETFASLKVKLFPGLGLGNVKFADWIQASPSRCNKCECSQIVNKAMTNSHFMHPASKPRVTRFTSSCIPVKSKCNPPLWQEPGHEVKVEKGPYLNGVEIIITIIVINNIYWACTLCQVLL